MSGKHRRADNQPPIPPLRDAIVAHVLRRSSTTPAADRRAAANDRQARKEGTGR